MHPTAAEINEYVEGSLEPAAAEAVRRHVEVCDACGALLDDLREIGRVAATLEEKSPPARTWPRIASALERMRDGAPGPEKLVAGRRWRQGWTWGLASAAAVALVAIWTARTMYVGGRAPAGTEESPTAQSIAAELALASEHYQKAIAGLEQVAAGGEESLDPATVATLQKNLAAVDQAITESRAALQAQPDSEPAQQSLLESFKAKVNLLQDTIGLINEFRKGNEAGAARMVSGLKKGA
jgi:anti-sigma factor ChrR (cupin superfamily)